MNILECKDTFIKCEFLKSHESIGNALRRIITAELPFYAIDQVVLEENTSNEYDNLICQRISLLPTIQHIKEEEKRWDFNCTHKTEQNRKENETSTKPKYVFSNVLSCSFLPDIPILELTSDMCVKGYVTLKKSNGREHTKYMAHTMCRFFRTKNNIHIFELETLENTTPLTILKQAIDIMIEKLANISWSK